ncbi:hypothetical protein PAPYR_8744 [Paratrimastix pyriformis]|uniref:Uncharacterized protein n=1 Tax=Paratrimastix pyriformis TaxID=342808 RepID=A0ABQ8UCH2_9EUKA|nr:hypothetical protein PAPYR_8744 [Paratrimastix pyriformis]
MSRLPPSAFVPQNQQQTFLPPLPPLPPLPFPPRPLRLPQPLNSFPPLIPPPPGKPLPIPAHLLMHPSIVPFPPNSALPPPPPPPLPPPLPMQVAIRLNPLTVPETLQETEMLLSGALENGNLERWKEATAHMLRAQGNLLQLGQILDAQMVALAQMRNGDVAGRAGAQPPQPEQQSPQPQPQHSPTAPPNLGE